MPIIKQSDAVVFDTEQIGRGDLIRAKYSGWDAPRNGLVFRVEPERLTVLFLPDVGNVSNFYIIQAGEVSREEWSLRWSHDLEAVEKEEGTAGDG